MSALMQGDTDLNCTSCCAQHCPHLLPRTPPPAGAPDAVLVAQAHALESAGVNLHLSTRVKGVWVVGARLHAQDVGQLDEAQRVLKGE